MCETRCIWSIIVTETHLGDRCLLLGGGSHSSGGGSQIRGAGSQIRWDPDLRSVGIQLNLITVECIHCILVYNEPLVAVGSNSSRSSNSDLLSLRA